uniref:Uncharacterized protein n=1 Tax=Avena sativa TaxID=4498 RepID=A0ACD5VFH4_AVESA
MNPRSYNKLAAVNEKMDFNTHGNTGLNGTLERNQSASKPAAYSQIPMDFSTRRNIAFNGTLDRNQSGISANPSTTSKMGAHSQIPSDKRSRQKNKEDPADKTNPGHGLTSTSETSATPTKETSTSMNTLGSPRSNSLDSCISSQVKHHTGGDCRWEAVQLATSRDSPLNLVHFRLLKRLGYGDIGSVYLVELRGTETFFAMKVMDKESLISRNKLIRAQTEREILGLLDHPFLPTLYTHFETEKFYCLVMEYCSGGNLHSLRQKQLNKHFSEHGARFYASEVLLALEYLHMLGIVYRDLKPENVLVRDGGHIMLSDFDLSLRCSVSPMLVKSSSIHAGPNGVVKGLAGTDGIGSNAGCIQPSAFFPRMLSMSKRNRKTKSDFGLHGLQTLEFNAEPTDARSMSFVGTHEYLAPEIIRGEGHGSSVDWWTFGIFLYELLHGMTPFKGNGNRATLCNVVEQPLRFPENPPVSTLARDLIRGLLTKDPHKRIASKRGATEIKQHPFFEGVNWALVRSAHPPSVPDPVDFSQYGVKEKKGALATTQSSLSAGAAKSATKGFSAGHFEYF